MLTYNSNWVLTRTLGRGESPERYRNGYGGYHLSGNAFEWCGDRYERSYYKDRIAQQKEAAQGGLSWQGELVFEADAGPGDSAGSSRVLRGGSFFFYDAGFCRSAGRYHFRPDIRFYDRGFRGGV